MSFVPNRSWDTEAAGDGLDAAIEIAWIAAEIAFNVFGMFFWAALLLFWLKAMT